jgi:hypothetical protein
MADRLPKVQHSRQPQDTASWCAERADADRAAAAATDNDNVRRRFELSATSWSARAEMLGWIEGRTQARAAAVRAEWDEEDVPLRAALRGVGGGRRDVRI